MNVCRTCLTEDADKDVSQLTDEIEIDDETHSSSEIMLFCLSIEVELHSKMTSKLCMKCYLKIISFYKFKVLALKNDEYLRSIETNGETKDELSSNLSDLDDARSEEMVYLEEDLTVEVKQEYDTKEVSSDDERLSVLKLTKYENDTKKEKENDFLKPVKKKIKKRKLNREIKRKEQICTECGKTVMNLKEHMNTHKPESIKKILKCKDDNCDKMFTNYSARLRHYKSIHLRIKKKCPECGKDVGCLRSHLINKHNKGPRTFECVVCRKNFHSKQTMEAHLDTHSTEKRYKCEICENRYSSKLTLGQHKRLIHENERPHLCDYCSKCFASKYGLLLHIRSHTKEKPVACPKCNKCFATPNGVKAHMTVHSDVKAFVCDICNAEFSRRGYLKNHMLSHTKEKPYPCKYCGTRFGRSDHRLRHERTAHEQHLPIFDVLKDKS